MIDFLAKRDIIETIIPINAISKIILAGTSGAWSPTGWVNIITSSNLTFPFILCGAYVYEVMLVAGADGVQAATTTLLLSKGTPGHEDDAGMYIGEGVAGLTITPGATETVKATSATTMFFEPILIPKSTYISINASSSSAKGCSLGVYLFGYDARYFANPIEYVKELRYIRGLTAAGQGSQVWPSPGVTNVAPNASTFWTYGTPVQFIASAPNPILITGLFGTAGTANQYAQAQIGVGAAGSEVWMSQVGLPCYTSQSGPCGDCWLPRPLFVKTGEAVSVQLEANKNNTYPVGIALRGFNLT